MINHSDLLPRLAILCNPALAGSYYVVVGATLDWIDPNSFMALEAMFLLPAAIIVLARARARIRPGALAAGAFLGLVLFINMLISIWSVAFTSVTNAGFYPALIGPLTALAGWMLLRDSLSPALAAISLLAFAGAVTLITSGFNTTGDWRGDVLALAATMVFVVYVLCMDRIAPSHDAATLWAAQMISVSICALIVYGAVGRTQLSVMVSPEGTLAGGYSAIFTTMLPVLFATYAQRHLSAVFVSFCYLLEPLWAAGLASVFLGERIGALQALGGGLLLASSFLMWFGDARKNRHTIEGRGQLV